MKTKIMVVDDDPNIRELVRLYLEKEGFEVTCAERGDEAVKMFRATPPAEHWIFPGLETG